MRTWFNLQAATGDKPAVLSIFDDIGAWGVTASNFNASLRTVSGDLNLEVSSLGGSVFDGVAIYNMLRNYAATEGNSLTVTVLGVAASIASVIAMAGTKIRMPANAYMMVHKPWGGVAGNSEEMRDYADLLDKIENSLIGTYVARTGKSHDEIKSMLEKDTWMTAAEAVEMGFADEVIEAVEVSASVDMDRLPEGVRASLKPVVAEDDKTTPAGDTPPDADDSSVNDEPPLAEQIAVAATAAGMPQLAAVWAPNPAVTPDTLAAHVKQAREIAALCNVAGHKDLADQFVRDGKTLAQARESLIAKLAAEDEDRPVDTSVKSSDKPNVGVQPTAVKTADIWAARRNPGVSK